MLVTTTLRAEAQTDLRPGFDKLASSTGPGFKPLLSTIGEAQAQVLGIAAEQLSCGTGLSDWVPRTTAVRAEILASDKALIILRLLDRPVPPSQRKKGEDAQRHVLLVIVVTAEPDLASVGLIQAKVKETMGIELQRYEQNSRAFQELLAEERPETPEPTKQEREAAQLLTQKETRRLAIGIKKAGGLLRPDAINALDPQLQPRANEILSALTKAGVTDKELVILCNQTGTQLARIQSRAVLSDVDGIGMHCACGAQFSQERCEELFTVSTLGASMLDKSRWLTILIVDHLQSVGVPLNRILVEQESGTEEMDCIAQIQGATVLFELKDKAFSIGNAYSFGSKINLIEPDVSVIVTTEHVGNDVKAHFQKIGRPKRRHQMGMSSDADNANTPMYIEGIEDVKRHFESIVTALSIRMAASSIGPILPMSIGNPSEMLVAWNDTITPPDGSAV